MLLSAMLIEFYHRMVSVIMLSNKVEHVKCIVLAFHSKRVRQMRHTNGNKTFANKRPTNGEIEFCWAFDSFFFT